MHADRHGHRDPVDTRLSWSTLLLAIALTCLGADPTQACDGPRVSTTAGDICGRTTPATAPAHPKRSVHAFVGIPYAKAPVGVHRFQPPTPAIPWKEVRDATSFSPSCPQNLPPGVSVPLSEDCLSLNVWTPDTSGRRPVLVFLHGGSFIRGGSAIPTYDGAKLAAAGPVVVVTLNYRLGALGFLAGLAPDDGNYGLLDQQLALRWVRDNAASFGGDPERVTLFGQESGAMAVGIHLSAPSSQDLFQAAIESSNPYGLPYKTRALARIDASEFAERLGCREPSTAQACLRAKSWPEILAAQAEARFGESLILGLSEMGPWSPIVDARPLVGQPNQVKLDKPAILGTVANEGIVFAARQASRHGGIDEALYTHETDLAFAPRGAAIRTLYERMAPGDRETKLARILSDDVFTCANRLVLTQARARVWGFRFTHPPSFPLWPTLARCAPGQNTVCEGAELPFVFGNPVRPQFGAKPASFTEAETRLVDTTMRLWAGFASAFAPPATNPPWAPFTLDDPLWMLIDEPLEQTRDLTAGCRFWDVLGYDRTAKLDELYRSRDKAPKP